MRAALEREVKLGVPPGFELPDLGDVGGGLTVEPGGTRVLDATYYDVDDLRLIRAGVTVRHRTGDADGEGTWTVKVPEGDAAVEGGLARSELEVDGPPGPVPDAIAAMVASRVRTAALAPVAQLQTTRRRLLVRGADGSVSAEVADDEVVVIEEGTTVASFREVEVELTPDAPEDVLGAIVDALRAAGAGEPDPTPKLARALGPRALRPPELVDVALDGRSRGADVVRASIASAAQRIIQNDPAAREGAVEGVHQARVGTRRLRSDLRTFRPLLDRAWADELRSELKWLADALGAVRDADVLIARLDQAASKLPPGDHAIAAQVVDLLHRERDAARDGLLAVYGSARYLQLLDALVAGAREPRLSDDAKRRASKVLPRLVRRPWRQLRRTVTALGEHPSDTELHGVRIRAKRARYAAAVAAPVIGAHADALEDALGSLQDVLGEQHDAVVAEEWLRSSATGPYTDGADALVVGELIGLQRAEAAELRAAWPTKWVAARKAGRGRWLS